MTTNELEQPSNDREQALLRLKKRRDLQGHLSRVFVINAALWAVWAATGAGYAWPAWVTGGWAIGLLCLALIPSMRAQIVS